MTQRAFGESEGECLWNFRRNPDELFATEQPIHAAGNEIEPLLVLRERVVLNECRIAYYHHAR